MVTVMVDVRPDFSRYFHDLDHVDAPPQIVVSKHWDGLRAGVRNALSGLDTLEEVVRYGQDSGAGFDQRSTFSQVFAEVAEYRRGWIAHFHNIDPYLRDEYSESPFSEKTGVVDHEGRRFSPSSLRHTAYMLNCLNNMEGSCARVLEIGGGYGGLARQFHRSGKVCHYVNIDVPESLAICFAFLKLNFPDKTVLLCASEKDIEQIDHVDFALVPINLVGLLPRMPFDLVINTASFQEMSGSAADYFIDLIQNRLKVRYFYSSNYFLEAKHLHKECFRADRENLNLVTPKLDPHWEIARFSINPGYLSPEGSRNILDVLVRRVPGAALSEGEVSVPSSDNADIGSEPYSNDWFASVWMGLWRNPDRDLIETFIDGYSQVRNGQDSDPDCLFEAAAQPFARCACRKYRRIHLLEPCAAVSLTALLDLME